MLGGELRERERERSTLQTASLFAVPTMHGWCEQNMMRVDILGIGEVARVADDNTTTAFTNTSTDGIKGTWLSDV